MINRVVSAFVCLAVAATGLTACAPSTPLSKSVTVSPETSAVLEIEGVLEVTIPAGSVDLAGTVTASREGSAPAGLDGLTNLQAWKLSIDGAELVAPVSIAFDLPDGSVGTSIAFFDETNGEWVQADTTVREDGWVVAQSTHFSWWQPWTWNLDTVGSWVTDAYLDLATPDNISDPECTDESRAAEVGVRGVVDGGQLVKWCVGLVGGRPQIKITNARFYGLGVFYPSVWSIASVGPQGGLVSTAIAGLVNQLPPAVTPADHGWITLGAGQTVELTGPPGGTALFNVQPDPLSYLASALVFGVETYTTVMNKSPMGPKPELAKSEKVLQDALETAACADSVSEFATTEWMGFDGSFAGFKTTLEIAFGCLAPSWAANYGLEGAIGSFVFSILTWLISGAALVAQSVSAIVDSLVNVDGFDLNVESGALDPASWKITSEGFGPLRLGGTRAELQQFLATKNLQWPDGDCVGGDVAGTDEWSLVAVGDGAKYDFYVMWAIMDGLGEVSTIDGITTGTAESVVKSTAGWQSLGIVQKQAQYQRIENGVPITVSIFDGRVSAIGVGTNAIGYEYCG